MSSSTEAPDGGLAALLEQASANDPHAFMRFYDQTAPIAFRLELSAPRMPEALPRP